ncbi:MFS transporter [Paenibacillus agilis]|uniref:MFS transporter n=1 Tax=Paenibacillus agilis TaxID=3020863 RepID=A0A559J382_9BACL|nr:MFS transporter [Paenibacillus agilis]TVX94321.1 MFS transporter [Paenibacillus agilis]
MGEQPLARKRTIFYATGNFSANVMAQMFAAYIVYYYVDILGARPSHVGIVMVMHGIIGAILNPLFGYVSDRYRTRWGRRIPYIAFGSIPLAAVFTLVWFPLAPQESIIYYFFGIVILFDILYVLVILNYSALFPEMFITIRERAAAASWKQMFGIVGMLVGVALPPLIYSEYGWESMGLVFGLCSAVFLLVTAAGAKERSNVNATKPIDLVKALRLTLRNRMFVIYVTGGFLVQFTFALLPAAIPFFSKYVLNAPELANTYMLGIVFLTAIPSVYVWARWTTKYGPRRAILAAIVLYMLSLLPLLFISTSAATYVTSLFIGFSLAGLMVLLEILLAEVIDQDEVKSGARREGMYFGMNGFIIRWGVSLQALIMSFLLENTGYVRDAAQQPELAIMGIRLMLAGIPIVALLFAFVCFYRLKVEA